LRLWLNTLLRLLSGTYFVLTSLYCLLAFLPYTFCALIKAPPYAWMPWFVHHQAALYCSATAAIVIANWRLQHDWRNGDMRFAVGLGLLVMGGAYITWRPFLPALESDHAAYWWSLVALLPLAPMGWWRGKSERDRVNPGRVSTGGMLFSYSTGVLIALAVSLIYVAGARLLVDRVSRPSSFKSADMAYATWSLVSHLAIAVLVVSVINLVWLLASKSRRPSLIRRGLMGTLIVVGLRFVLVRFLDSAMSFDGWAAQVYAAWLALTLTLWGFSLVLPLLGRQETTSAESLPRRALTWAAIVVLGALALASRSLIGGEDWNGFVQNTWALIFWIALSVCVYRLRPMRMNYSPAVVVATLLLSAAAYKGLQLTEIFWARPLGSTDDEISLALEEYGGRDASFLLAHHVLGNGRYEKCGDLCRILREYTNIRDNRVTSGVRLVDELTPAQGERPNIFLFVIDSMRPDYLGAYNPRNVDYTPNLDALARDSVVFTNVYTQYAGTSLSEPAIWSGALLLHTHFPQPFAKVNSLQVMAHTDGYQMVVSYDTVLRQLFPASDGLTTLDTDKKVWNQYEACSTVEQLESVLDARADKAKPVLFYAQPMNVHQFAKNDVPSLSSQHWHAPAGLITRITYEVHWVDSCLGQFFTYLKQRGMYDNSVIVVTSDHGDATGEFGRTSHSTSIWPEIMRVPLIVHVPPRMREHLAYDPGRISALIDITPTLYYLLGHRPIRPDPLYGRPLFAETKQELESYGKDDLLLASDVRAVYGILTADARYLYVTYDSPAQSYLFDLTKDPNAQHNIVTPQLKRRYDEEIIEHLHLIADHYGYKPGVGSLLATARR
jgi:hypothetical protein